MDKSDRESKGLEFKSAAGQRLVPLSKVLYSNCSLVRKVTLRGEFTCFLPNF